MYFIYSCQTSLRPPASNTCVCNRKILTKAFLWKYLWLYIKINTSSLFHFFSSVLWETGVAFLWGWNCETNSKHCPQNNNRLLLFDKKGDDFVSVRSSASYSTFKNCNAQENKPQFWTKSNKYMHIHIQKRNVSERKTTISIFSYLCWYSANYLGAKCMSLACCRSLGLGNCCQALLVVEISKNSMNFCN